MAITRRGDLVALKLCAARSPGVLRAVVTPAKVPLLSVAVMYERVDVVILGSPFYAATNDPTFSMAEGVIPNDGHLLDILKSFW